MKIVSCPPTVQVVVNRPDTKYQLGFSVQNGMVILFFHLQYPLYKRQRVTRECIASCLPLWNHTDERNFPFVRKTK